MKHYRFLGALAATGTVVLSISSANAQTCNVTSDCPNSYVCLVVATGASGCGSADAGVVVSNPGNPVSPPEADAGMRAAGGAVSQPVPTPAGGASGTASCTTTTEQVKECVAQNCNSDADCSVGWYCQVNNITCPTAAPLPAKGDAGLPPAGTTSGSSNATTTAGVGGTASVKSTSAAAASDNCVASTQSTCQPKAQNPCNVPADCGPGYDCVNTTTCVCSVSGSAGTAAGSGAANSGAVGSAVDAGTTGSASVATAGATSHPSTTPSCNCGPSGYAACKPQTIACQTLTDCPETWTCSTAGGSASTTGGTCISPLGNTTGKGYTVSNDGSQSTVTPTASSPDSGVVGSGNDAVTGGSLAGTNSAAVAAPSTAGHITAQGGCRVSQGQHSQFAVLILGLLAMFGLHRRRRAA